MTYIIKTGGVLIMSATAQAQQLIDCEATGFALQLLLICTINELNTTKKLIQYCKDDVVAAQIAWNTGGCGSLGIGTLDNPIKLASNLIIPIEKIIPPIVPLTPIKPGTTLPPGVLPYQHQGGPSGLDQLLAQELPPGVGWPTAAHPTLKPPTVAQILALPNIIPGGNPLLDSPALQTAIDNCNKIVAALEARINKLQTQLTNLQDTYGTCLNKLQQYKDQLNICAGLVGKPLIDLTSPLPPIQITPAPKSPGKSAESGKLLPIVPDISDIQRVLFSPLPTVNDIISMIGISPINPFAHIDPFHPEFTQVNPLAEPPVITPLPPGPAEPPVIPVGKLAGGQPYPRDFTGFLSPGEPFFFTGTCFNAAPIITLGVEDRPKSCVKATIFFFSGNTPIDIVDGTPSKFDKLTSASSSNITGTVPLNATSYIMVTCCINCTTLEQIGDCLEDKFPITVPSFISITPSFISITSSITPSITPSFTPSIISSIMPSFTLSNFSIYEQPQYENNENNVIVVEDILSKLNYRHM